MYLACGVTTIQTCGTINPFEEVKQVHQTLIENNVALSTTLAIFETQARGKADQRSLEALAPFYRDAYENWKKRKLEKGKDWYFKEA